MASPNESIPSMSKEMLGLRVKNKDEKALLVRIGTLIDALIAAQRGLSNPGNVSRRRNLTNLKKPQLLTGRTENLFNAANVSLDPSGSSANMSHQEVQIDRNPNFSDPTQKDVFANNVTFKSLAEGAVYNIRARPVTKDGQIGDWATLDPVETTSSTGAADIDGDSLGNTVLSKAFTVSNNAQQFFCGSALGFRSVSATTTSSLMVPLTPPAATATQTLIRDRIDVDSVVTVPETITLPGLAGTTFTAPSEGSIHTVTVTRNNPIIFFTLITPSTPSYPATAFLDVQIAEGTGAYSSSTEDTVWVEF